jgi:serine/threonine protein kinase
MNILLTGGIKAKECLEKANLKLGDMGESRVLDTESYIKTEKIIGTPLSMAPEVVKSEGYD